MTAAPVAYTPDELVDIMKLTRRTIYEFLRTGRLRGVKIGDTWRVSQEELHRFMGVNLGSTLGEKHFTYYLNQNGIPFEYEKEWPGKRAHPDFSIPVGGRYYLFEVKDLEGPVPLPGASFFDPVKPIRDHITAAQKQFREFPDESCSIVLFNRGVLTFLDDPFTMFGAMHGTPALQLRVNPRGTPFVDGPPQPVFTGKKAKVRSSATESDPKNTRISALIGLRTVDIGLRRMSRYLLQFPGDAWIQHLRDDVQEFDPNEVGVGVTVWENRDAKIKLPETLFRGPFDEQWTGPDEEGIERAYEGATLKEYRQIETELKACVRIEFEERKGKS